MNDYFFKYQRYCDIHGAYSLHVLVAYPDGRRYFCLVCGAEMPIKVNA